MKDDLPQARLAGGGLPTCYDIHRDMEHKDSEVFEAEGRRLLAEGQADKALLVFRDGLTRFPDDADLLLGSALAHLEMGDFVQGCELLEPLAARFPGWAEVSESLVEACLRMGRTGKAVEAAEKAASQPEADHESVHLLGYMLFVHGHYAEAARCYERAARLNPTYAPARMGLAACRHRLGKKDEAVSLLQDLIRRAPDYWEAYAYLGNLLCDEGRVPEGKAVLEKIPLERLWDPTAIRRLLDLACKGSPRRRELKDRLEAVREGGSRAETPSQVLDEADRLLGPKTRRAKGFRIGAAAAKGKSAGPAARLESLLGALFRVPCGFGEGERPAFSHFDKELCAEFLARLAEFLEAAPPRIPPELLFYAVEIVGEMRRRFKPGVIDEELLRRLREAMARLEPKARRVEARAAWTSLLKTLEAPWNP